MTQSDAQQGFVKEGNALSKWLREFAELTITQVRTTLSVTIVASLAILVMCPRIFAQEFRGTISGTVADPSGAVIPNATIEVRESSTGTTSRTTSDAAGQYVVPFLLPGNYSITANATGFQKLTRTGSLWKHRRIRWLI